MGSRVFASILSILIAPVAVLILRRIRQRLIRRKFADQHNCQSAIRFPHREPFFGLDFFFKIVKYTKEKRRLEFTKELYERYGPTWQVTSFGRDVINTIDPENIQSVMALDFESWGLAPLRYPAAGPFMGRGVFTSDGPFWQQARAQIKPALARA